MTYLLAIRCGLHGHWSLVPPRRPHDARGPVPCSSCWKVPRR